MTQIPAVIRILYINYGNFEDKLWFEVNPFHKLETRLISQKSVAMIASKEREVHSAALGRGLPAPTRSAQKTIFSHTAQHDSFRAAAW